MRIAFIQDEMEFNNEYRRLRQNYGKTDKEIADKLGFESKNSLVWNCRKKILEMDEIRAILKAIDERIDVFLSITESGNLTIEISEKK